MRRLAEALGLACSDDASLQLPSEGMTKALIQAGADGTLLIHGQSSVPDEGDEDERELLWAHLLARNAPQASVHTTVHGWDEQGHTITLHSRLARADRYTLDELVQWTRAFASGTTHHTVAPDHRAHDDQAFAMLWQALGHEYELPADDPAHPNSWMLVPDEGPPVEVLYLEATGEVLLRATVSVLPTEAADDQPYFRALLQANWLGTDTAGSVFAIDEDLSEIIVWHREPARWLSAQELSCLIGHIADLARRFAPGADAD
jgi:hypothetical protein